MIGNTIRTNVENVYIENVGSLDGLLIYQAIVDTDSEFTSY
jgi:hypothetical protein